MRYQCRRGAIIRLWVEGSPLDEELKSVAPDIVVISRTGEDSARFQLVNPFCLIGSAKDCDIIVSIPGVKPVHCQLEMCNEKVLLTDFSSNVERMLSIGEEFSVQDRHFRLEKGISDELKDSSVVKDDSIADPDPNDSNADPDPDDSIADSIADPDPDDSIADPDPNDSNADPDPDDSIADSIADPDPNDSIADPDPDDSIADPDPDGSIADPDPDDSIADPDNVMEREDGEGVGNSFDDDNIADPDPDDSIADPDDPDNVMEREDGEHVENGNSFEDDSIADSYPDDSIADPDYVFESEDEEDDECGNSFEDDTIADPDPDDSFAVPDPDDPDNVTEREDGDVECGNSFEDSSSKRRQSESKREAPSTIIEPSVTEVETPLFPQIKIQTIKKKSDNKKHCCVFCEKLYPNIARHMTLKHDSEIEVGRILALPIRSKQRRQLWGKLVNRGDFSYNFNVLKSRSGTIIPKYRVGNEEIGLNVLLPCQHCHGMYRRTQLWRHQKVCKKNENTSGYELGPVKSGKRMLPPRCDDKAFQEHIVDNMKDDKIKAAVLSDETIKQYGMNLYDEQGHQQHRHNYISQKMRELGRLLLAAKNNNIKSIKECMHRENWDNFITSVKEISEFNKETNLFGIPSLALKVGHTMKTCAEQLYFRTLKEGDSGELRLVLHNGIKI